VEGVTLALTLTLLVFGVSLLFLLRRRGGPELALARLLADSRRRTIFLGALCTSLAALFGIGLADSVGTLVGAPGAEMIAVRAGLFAMGSAGILVLMFDALHRSPLTLEETWNLRETTARVTSASPPVPTPIDLGPTPSSSDRGPRWPGR
jgi:hypothetical protein